VEDGVLKTWILDCTTARELGLTTTGHAQRGVSSTPSPGASNLHLAPGSKTPAELIADIAEGLYVTDLIGMGANMVTGDYSRGCSGFWIERGELTYPVSEITIAGHLNDIFRTLAPANDLVFRYGTNAPTVRIEGRTVAGVGRARPRRGRAPSCGGCARGGLAGAQIVQGHDQELEQGGRFAGKRGRHRARRAAARPPRCRRPALRVALRGDRGRSG